MAIVKQSFLSNIIGKNTYDKFNSYAKLIIAIGSCLLAVIFLFSFFFHCKFISCLLDLVTGTSLLFVVYVAAFILVLDIEVGVDEPQRSCWSESAKKPKTRAYKLTIVWGVILLVFDISAIYFSNIYKKQYAFECNTFLVNHQARIYHIDWDNDCEVASKVGKLEKMQGYQIDKSYTLCKWCEEWAEDTESEYKSNSFFRR